MIQVAIEEPKIEAFFNHSQEEILKALRYLVNNNIKEFDRQSSPLSKSQKQELDARIEEFYQDPTIARPWDEVKQELMNR